jgi:ethanolamine utilization protein EutA
LQALNVQRPQQTLRATVLGAASQTVTLSGSTIWAEKAILPLRNLPVIRPQLPAAPTPESIAQAIGQAMLRWDVKDGRQSAALALDLPQRMDFETLQTLARGVVAYASQLPQEHPLILITERDYAQSLGQTIKALRPDLPLVVIDQVGLGEGDFIDIGEPMLDGRVVPLSVKTLIFYH